MKNAAQLANRIAESAKMKTDTLKGRRGHGADVVYIADVLDVATLIESLAVVVEGMASGPTQVAPAAAITLEDVATVRHIAENNRELKVHEAQVLHRVADALMVKP